MTPVPAEVPEAVWEVMDTTEGMFFSYISCKLRAPSVLAAPRWMSMVARRAGSAAWVSGGWVSGASVACS